jgi:hypothetical protein
VDYRTYIFNYHPTKGDWWEDEAGNKIEAPSGKWLTPDLAYTTGFAPVPGSQAYVNIDSEVRKLMPTVIPRRLIHGVPDMEPRASISELVQYVPGGILHPAGAAEFINRFYADSVRYGYGARQPSSLLALEHSPYLTNAALLGLIASHRASPEAAAALIKGHIGKTDPGAASQLHRMLGSGGPAPVLITGSGRGDYTLSRAVAAARQNTDRPIIAALGAHGEQLASLYGELPNNVFPIKGSIPQKDYMILRGGMINLPPTSGAEYSEMLANRSAAAIVPDASLYKRQEAAAFGSRMPPDLRAAHSGVNLPVWNRGQVAHALNDKPYGVLPIHRPEEIEKTIQQLERMDPRLLQARGKAALEGSIQARQRLAKFLTSMAKHSEWVPPMAQGLATVGVPALLIGAPFAMAGGAGGAAAAASSGDDLSGAIDSATHGALLAGGIGTGAGALIGLRRFMKVADYGHWGAGTGALLGGTAGALYGYRQSDDRPDRLRGILLPTLTGGAAGALAGAGIYGLARMAHKYSRIPTKGGVEDTPKATGHDNKNYLRDMLLKKNNPPRPPGPKFTPGEIAATAKEIEERERQVREQMDALDIDLDEVLRTGKF